MTEQIPISKFNRRLPYVLSFLIPVFIMIGIFAGKEIYPFGSNSFLRTDMYHQYAPFFSELYQKLHQGQSLTYSWDIGMGTNFTALFGYYLSSPLNWLVFLMPSSLVIEFMTYLIVFKIGLSGVTFFHYLKSRRGRGEIGMVFFAVFYALSGYMAAYSWNIMWLDCILLAPLILLGLERLVKENRGLLYCGTLGLAILSNYYIAIMLCIFLVLYFIVCMVDLPLQTFKSYLKKCGLFAFFSLLAGALAAVILIPEIYALGLTASADSTFPTTLTSYFSVIEMLARHMMLVEVEIGLDHWPNIYCGVMTMLCIPLYMMNRRVPYKEKITKCLLLLFLLFSFATNIPNYIWHGMHYPNSLPCRQSFLYIAVLLTMAYEGFKDLKHFRVSALVGTFWGVVIFLLVAQKLVDPEEIESYVFYINIVFIGIYALFAYLYRRGLAKSFTLICLTFVVVMVEMALNTAVTSVTITSRTSYVKYTDEFRSLLEYAKRETPGFFRTEKMSLKTKNDGAWVGYHSASTFSSTAYAGLSDFYEKVGMEASMNAYSITGATPLIDSLFSIKYRLSTTELPESMLYTEAAREGDAILYRNNYVLPLGFMLPEDFQNTWIPSSSDIINSQNQFVLQAAGTDNVFDMEDGVTEGNTFTVDLQTRGHVFVEVTSSSVEEVEAAIGSTTKSFDNVERGYLLDLGYCDPDDSIVLTSDEDTVLYAYAYTVNEEALADAVNALSDEPFVIDNFTETDISGHITALSDGLFFTSIPYDPGWTLYVDGEKTEYEAFHDAFICVPLSAGEHSIQLVYETQGLKVGLLISGNALLLFIILACLSSFLKKKRQIGEAPTPDPETSPIVSDETASLETDPLKEPAAADDADDANDANDTNSTNDADNADNADAAEEELSAEVARSRMEAIVAERRALDAQKEASSPSSQEQTAARMPRRQRCLLDFSEVDILNDEDDDSEEIKNILNNLTDEDEKESDES